MQTKMPIPDLITANWLEDLGACEDAVVAFTETFPDGCGLDVEVAVWPPEFDFDWLAKKILKATAWAEYERVTAPALAEYERVKATAWAEYERVTAPALAEYKHMKTTARAEYERVKATALAEYERVTAPALVAIVRGN